MKAFMLGGFATAVCAKLFPKTVFAFMFSARPLNLSFCAWMVPIAPRLNAKVKPQLVVGV